MLGKKDEEWREADNNLYLQTYQPGSEAERKLVRKIDLHIVCSFYFGAKVSPLKLICLTYDQVPAIWVLYTLSYLDRANIGNAKSGGMEDDLNLTSNQYSVILLVFFISYVVFEVPSNMILTRMRPSLFLSGICILWGGVAACMAAGNNWSQIAAIRFCLGVIEAAFAPGVAYYLSCWYKTHELARRYSIYYTGTSLFTTFWNNSIRLTKKNPNHISDCGFRRLLWFARGSHRPVSRRKARACRLEMASPYRRRRQLFRGVVYVDDPPRLA